MQIVQLQCVFNCKVSAVSVYLFALCRTSCAVPIHNSTTVNSQGKLTSLHMLYWTGVTDCRLSACGSQSCDGLRLVAWPSAEAAPVGTCQA